MHSPIPLEHIKERATNVPIIKTESVETFSPHTAKGALRYEAPLDRGINLETLLVNKQSDVLLVSFHGAITRKKIILPMFERLTSFGQLEHNLMLVSDPTLRLADNLELSWYTGWENLDLRPIIAEWATKAAEATNAKQIIFYGGSGGGFASLQMSAHTPGSIAIAMNPQIEINGYKVEGIHLGPLRRYVRVVWPHLSPVPIRELDDTHGWHSTLGDRVSAAQLYSKPVDNRVLFVQNRNDHSHMDRHHGAFKTAVENGPNRDNVIFEYYNGPNAHAGPTPKLVQRTLRSALSWI